MNSLPTLAHQANSASSISKNSRSLLQSLFYHHDGIVVGATISALKAGGLLDFLLQKKTLYMDEISKEFSCNPGYIHVAMRCLALQGWIKRFGEPASDRLRFEMTPKGEIAAATFGRYANVADFVYSGVPMTEYMLAGQIHKGPNSNRYCELVEFCRRNWDLPRSKSAEHKAVMEVIKGHLDGMLVAPWMIAAKLLGLLEEKNLSEQLAGFDPAILTSGISLLEFLGWLRKRDDHWCYTDIGKIARDYSLHYGLTLSYTPLFSELPKLLFKAKKNVTHVRPGTEEQHVDRILNVLASGVAHKPYFADSDRIMIDVFNREPLSAQPRFVADMGCGDGAWLKRIFDVVKNQTLRGRHIDRYPLLMVGADYNLKARQVASQLLDQSAVPNIVLFGDIGDPSLFAKDLQEHGIDIRDGLHIRAFIDHNRPYKSPLESAYCAARPLLSTGAFADEDGRVIPNRRMEQSLVEHFKRWTPYIGKHGLIILEAHDVDPEIACRYIGRTHATAFDTYHGYSNQYPVDFEPFMLLAEEAGFRSVIYQQQIYPSKLPFVAISLNRFRADRPLPQVDAINVDCPKVGLTQWRPGFKY